MTRKDIARSLGYSEGSVEHALDPEKRRKRSRSNKPHSNPNRDWKRNWARVEARSRWRQEGCRRDLESYYRELNCL